jgi:hypothetical protein
MKIVWLLEAPLETAPDGRLTSSLASVRYRALIPADRLQQAGIESRFLSLATMPRADIESALATDRPVALIIGKSFSADALIIAHFAKSIGVRVLVDYCDHHFRQDALGTHQRALADVADQLIASTPVLAEIIEAETHRSPILIPDPYEGPQGQPLFDVPADRPVRLLWFGHPSNLDAVQDIAPQLEHVARDIPLTLTLLTDLAAPIFSETAALYASMAPHVTLSPRPWSLPDTWAEIAATDLVILPSRDTDFKSAKGPNRLIESLWGGRAVLAFPLPAYREFKPHVWLGENFANGILYALNTQPYIQRQIATGQSYIAAHYSPDAIGKRWHTVLTSTFKDHPHD